MNATKIIQINQNLEYNCEPREKLERIHIKEVTDGKLSLAGLVNKSVNVAFNYPGISCSNETDITQIIVTLSIGHIFSSTTVSVDPATLQGPFWVGPLHQSIGKEITVTAQVTVVYDDDAVVITGPSYTVKVID